MFSSISPKLPFHMVYTISALGNNRQWPISCKADTNRQFTISYFYYFINSTKTWTSFGERKLKLRTRGNTGRTCRLKKSENCFDKNVKAIMWTKLFPWTFRI